MTREAPVRRNGRLAGLAALVMGVTIAGAARADRVNVSKVATGTFTPIVFSHYDNAPKVNGATLTYFTLATGAIDTEAATHFAETPWTAAMVAAPTYPSLARQAANAPYDQGGSHFEYGSSQSRLARAAMDVAPPKTVDASIFARGAARAGATVTYRVRIAHTSAAALDYFVDLAVPQPKRSIQPAYNLCCSGDSNGGTYNYLRPNSAQARTEADVYVDGLPVWSSASTYVYPAVSGASPFDEADMDWDKGASPASTTLYLGRLSQGQTLTVTLEARSDVAGNSDCGMVSPGSYLSHTYTIQCLALRETVPLSGGANGAPVGFTVYSKAPQ
jgi:hypothetical protein